MFSNRVNLKLFALLACVVIASATMMTEFGSSLDRQFGVKGAVATMSGAVMLVLLIARLPTENDSQNSRVAFILQLTCAGMAFLAGLFWLLAEAVSGPDLRFIAVVPNVVIVTTITLLSIYLRWGIDRDMRRENPKFELHIVLGGPAILGLGFSAIYIMATLSPHVFF